MYSDNKQIRDVADVAARIMAGLPPLQEKLHPNQQKIDVVDDEKIDGKDFAKLRKMKKEDVTEVDESHQAATTMKHIPNPTPALKQAAKDIKPGVGGYRDRIDMLKAGGVKEEVEELDEVSLKTATSAYVKRMGKEDEKSPVKAVKTMDHIAKKHGVVGVARAAKAADKEYGLNDTTHNKRKDFVRGVMAGVKEEVEAIDEVKMADLPSTKVQGRSYGSSKPQPSAFDVLKGPKDKELKSIESEEKKKKMSEMVALYKDGGMKAFFESIKKEDFISEEPDSEQFAKELEDQKKRAAGTKPQADVAKASVQSVKQEATEQDIQVINADLANGVDQVNIEERTLTPAETDKKEATVKSMKKNLSGFKERYGKDAKSVMYATATKQAKKD